MSDSSLSDERLDSWKAIAKYLHRDLATVRRWEKSHGLPIRRVGLTGRSVFAYRREIDEWLTTPRPVLASPEAPAPAMSAANASRAIPWRPILMTAAVTALGLAPLAFGINRPGQEIEGPMAVVILGGLVTSTALNLLVLPTLSLKYGRFVEALDE